MDDQSEQVLAKAQDKLHQLEAEVLNLKRFINQVHELQGKPPVYSDADLQAKPTSLVIKSGQFFGRPLATVVREFLELRRPMGAPSLTDIFTALKTGGYEFEQKDDSEAKRILSINLSKNPIFHRLANGDYGLLEWWPTAKEKKEQAKPKKRKSSKSATPVESARESTTPDTKK
jgi:hypothetical protein